MPIFRGGGRKPTKKKSFGGKPGKPGRGGGKFGSKPGGGSGGGGGGGRFGNPPVKHNHPRPASEAGAAAGCSVPRIRPTTQDRPGYHGGARHCERRAVAHPVRGHAPAGVGAATRQ